MNPTDEELDAYILTRLALIGVDLGVLPEDDASAPADRRRILTSARNFLRQTVGAISDFPIPSDAWAPVLYPAAQPDRDTERR